MFAVTPDLSSSEILRASLLENATPHIQQHPDWTADKLARQALAEFEDYLSHDAEDEGFSLGPRQLGLIVPLVRLLSQVSAESAFGLRTSPSPVDIHPFGDDGVEIVIQQASLGRLGFLIRGSGGVKLYHSFNGKVESREVHL